MDRKGFIIGLVKKAPPPDKMKRPGSDEEPGGNFDDDAATRESYLESFASKLDSGDYAGADKALYRYISARFPSLATDDADDGDEE